jgi:hypothetical protein
MSPRPRLSEPVSVLAFALAGFLLALAFIYVLLTTTTAEERMNFYDSLGQSTNVRWR